MSTQIQERRAFEDLEAAESLLSLFKNPRTFETFPVVTDKDGVTSEQDNINQPQLVRSVTPVPTQDGVNPQDRSGNDCDERPRQHVSGEQALQAYLIRQQIIAGIPPERITRMRRCKNQDQASTPALIQINKDGVRFPVIPPAQFNGVFHPLPVRHPKFDGVPSGATGEACPNAQSEIQ